MSRSARPKPGIFYFTATGGVPVHRPVPTSTAGSTGCSSTTRLIRSPAGMTVLLQATTATDGVIQPDNLDTNRQGQLMIQENPNREQRGKAPFDWTPMNPSGGEARIWFYDTNTDQLVAAVAQQSQLPAAPTWATSDDNPPGEASGSPAGSSTPRRSTVKGAWLFDVQANSLSNDQIYQLVIGSQFR